MTNSFNVRTLIVMHNRSGENYLSFIRVSVAPRFPMDETKDDSFRLV